MSRRNYRNSDDGVEAALGCLAFVGLLIVGLISWVKGWFETPLIEQIQQLDRKAYWGAEIKARACPQCAVANEGHRYTCFQCGTTLIDISTATRKASQSSPDKFTKFIFVLLGISLFIYLLMGIGATLGFY